MIISGPLFLFYFFLFTLAAHPAEYYCTSHSYTSAHEYVSFRIIITLNLPIRSINYNIRIVPNEKRYRLKSVALKYCLVLYYVSIQSMFVGFW